MQYATRAVLLHVLTAGLKINHFTILFGQKTTRAMIEIKEIEMSLTD
jgi:hypothetical protein